MNWFGKRILLVAGLLAGTTCAGLAADNAKPTTESKPVLSDYYGFLPLEIYKLNRRSRNLVAADMNDDQLNDMVLVANSNSRIDLVLQRAEPPPSEQPEAGTDAGN